MARTSGSCRKFRKLSSWTSIEALTSKTTGIAVRIEGAVDAEIIQPEALAHRAQRLILRGSLKTAAGIGEERGFLLLHPGLARHVGRDVVHLPPALDRRIGQSIDQLQRRSLVILMPYGSGGATRIMADFDAGFGSCTGQVTRARIRRAITRVYSGIIKRFNEVKSVQVGGRVMAFAAATCLETDLAQRSR